jgi:hypothetical protein
MDEREAFCRAVRLYRFDDWKPGAPDQPRLDVKGNSCTIEQTCELVAAITDHLPDDVVGDLAAAFYRGPNTDLAAEFGKDLSYATGSGCLLKLLKRRLAEYQQQQAH